MFDNFVWAKFIRHACTDLDCEIYGYIDIFQEFKYICFVIYVYAYIYMYILFIYTYVYTHTETQTHRETITNGHYTFTHPNRQKDPATLTRIPDTGSVAL